MAIRLNAGGQHFSNQASRTGISSVQSHDPWNLDFPLFSWSPFDPYTLGAAYESMTILGELGSGKSSGSAILLLERMLAIGAGALINCVKPDDAESAIAAATRVGRSESLIVVSPKNKWRCNILRYAQKKPGITGSRVESIVALLMTIVESTERSERGKTQSGDVFWNRSLRALLRDAVEVCLAARDDISMRLLDEVISSAPRNPAEVHIPEWQASSICYKLIEEAEGKSDRRSPSQQRDYELAATHLLKDFPATPDETRGSILATYRSMADILLRGHMAELFDSGTNLLPELTHEGAIIILDLPSRIYGQAGINVQSAFTYLWQMAAEQRDVKANPRPLLWYIDEAADLVNDYTAKFLSTSRSARVASCLCSQNLPGLMAAMGGESGRHSVMAMIANTGTRVFHSQGDIETNRYASETINDAVLTRMNFHSSRDGHGPGNGGGSESVGRKVMPSEFTTLKKGGAQNNFVTEAIVFQTGASFAANDGEPYLRTAFKQIIPGVTVEPDGDL